VGIFEKFGEYYDLIYRGFKNYENECKALEKIFTELSKKKPKSVLDVGCGTGSHALIFARHGCEVAGIDISKVMIEKARVKARKEKAKIEFSVQDMRKIRLSRKFDAAVSMFGAIGYINSYEGLTRVFSSIKRHLNKDGLFLFEFWNLTGIRPTPYQRWMETKDKKITVYRLSETNLNPHSNILTLDMKFIVLKKDKPVETFEEKHLHRCYTQAEMRHYLENNGFRPLAAYDWDAEDVTELKEPKRETFRILAVARKS